jgi:hypothetical protein
MDGARAGSWVWTSNIGDVKAADGQVGSRQGTNQRRKAGQEIAERRRSLAWSRKGPKLEGGWVGRRKVERDKVRGGGLQSRQHLATRGTRECEKRGEKRELEGRVEKQRGMAVLYLVRSSRGQKGDQGGRRRR